MNTDCPAKHYASLTPWERLPLILAASVRADAVERECLIRSAPHHAFRVPDYRGLAEGLNELGTLYLLDQLERIASYWRLEASWDSRALSSDRREVRQWDKRAGQLKRLLAYRLVVGMESWRLLCAELHIDADVLLRGLPGYEAVQQMEPLARLMAFSAEEALAFLRESVAFGQSLGADTSGLQGEPRLETAAEVAQSLREYLRTRLDRWR
jgi:hypothetical protein